MKPISDQLQHSLFILPYEKETENNLLKAYLSSTSIH